MIALRPLREDEYADWDAAHRAEYARALIARVGCVPGGRRHEGRAGRRGRAPDRCDPRDADLGGRGRHTVGTVFVGIRDAGAWLYDITIDEDERGRGYRRAWSRSRARYARSATPRSRAQRLGRERGRARALQVARLGRGIRAHAQTVLSRILTGTTSHSRLNCRPHRQRLDAPSRFGRVVTPPRRSGCRVLGHPAGSASRAHR